MVNAEKNQEFKKITLTPYWWVVTRNDEIVAFIARASSSIHHVFDTDYMLVMNNLPSMQSAYNTIILALSKIYT